MRSHDGVEKEREDVKGRSRLKNEYRSRTTGKGDAADEIYEENQVAGWQGGRKKTT